MFLKGSVIVLGRIKRTV